MGKSTNSPAITMFKFANCQKLPESIQYYPITMWGPRSIAKLVYKSNFTMVYGTQITIDYSYWGESKPTNITGGPHIVVPHTYNLWIIIQ